MDRRAASPDFSRRDFLKLVSLIPAVSIFQPLSKIVGDLKAAGTPNVIVVVFDAWSAHDVQLYGYLRQTMPNLERFAGNAIVYHNHYSAGTFTVPGTASLLTGLYPWSHRALQLGAGIIKPQVNREVFSMVHDAFSTLGYTQNAYADIIMGQAEKNLDVHLRTGSFDLENDLLYNLPLFKNDSLISYTALENNLFQLGEIGNSGSLFIAPSYNYWLSHAKSHYDGQLSREYPEGLPDSGSNGLYTLDGVVNGVVNALGDIKDPTFAYIHFYPPHEPYAPTAEFIKAFDDGWRPAAKPIHPLAYKAADFAKLGDRRKLYDQYLASWDAAVGRLFDYFEESGLRDRSYIFITADHGEMFERGEIGHFTPLIYDPVMHIPLIVSTPQQRGRQDVYTLTSNVDILPTVSRLANLPLPAWAEGEILPGLGGSENADRGVFVVDAKENSSFAPLTEFSVSLTKNGYRLTYYKYTRYSGFELYNLLEDPEELRNLYSAQPSEASALYNELMQKLADVNRPYLK